jgi:hypothetical protein
MPNRCETLKPGTTNRCVICNGRFGLVRYYSWRTPFCSKCCVERFRARRTSHRDWVGRLQITVDQLLQSGARTS